MKKLVVAEQTLPWERGILYNRSAVCLDLTCGGQRVWVGFPKQLSAHMAVSGGPFRWIFLAHDAGKSRTWMFKGSHWIARTLEGVDRQQSFNSRIHLNL